MKDLAQGTTEETLTKTLSEQSVTPTKVFMMTFDKIVFAQICFASYQNMCDAAAIIDKEGNNLTRANNKQKAHFNEKTSVFVRSLPNNVDDDMLFSAFQSAGSVINCQVLKDHNAVSKQMGLVNFSSPEGASNAITKMHGTVFQGSNT